MRYISLVCARYSPEVLPSYKYGSSRLRWIMTILSHIITWDSESSPGPAGEDNKIYKEITQGYYTSRKEDAKVHISPISCLCLGFRGF